MEQKRIYVVGACQGAGATFVATSLAFSLAEMTSSVAFVESPRTNIAKEEVLIINQLSLEKLKSKEPKLYANVCWLLFETECKGKTVEPNLEKIHARYIICDSPAEYRNCDLIICVVDALPSKVVASSNKVKHLNTYFGNKTVWVFNRNIISNTKMAQKYLGIKFDFVVPMEKQESFYKAEHFGKPLQLSSFFSSEVKESIENIAKYIVSLY